MTDLVRYSPPDPNEWGQLKQTTEMVVGTDFAPRQIRQSKGAIMAALLTGRELGIGPMQSLRDIYMVEGKPSLSAQLMVGLVRARGHKIRPLETTSTVARVQGVRSDDPEYPAVVEYTIEDAKQAGLAGKDVWKKYPKSMLWARAVSQLCRQMFADVLAGAAYTAEELRDGEVDEAETTSVTWIEPVQDTGPQGKQAGKRGEGATQPVESAVPVQTSGPGSLGKESSGPDSTPAALVPPGDAGGRMAPQQGDGPSPAAGASADWFDELINQLFITLTMATDYLAKQPQISTFLSDTTEPVERADKLRHLDPESALAKRVKSALTTQFRTEKAS